LRSDFHLAIEFYDQQITIAREIGDLKGEANSLLNKSVALDHLGQLPEAVTHAETALKIFGRIKNSNEARAQLLLDTLRAKERGETESEERAHNDH
jgi:hypothetical protein